MFTEIIATAINYGPRTVAGMTKFPLDIRNMADAAKGNMGTFLADLEESFPAEFEAALEGGRLYV
jgi:hypothetical protein